MEKLELQFHWNPKVFPDEQYVPCYGSLTRLRIGHEIAQESKQFGLRFGPNVVAGAIFSQDRGNVGQDTGKFTVHVPEMIRNGKIQLISYQTSQALHQDTLPPS